MKDDVGIELLPIGSVVVLEGGSVPIMIGGRMQQSSTSKSIWDYVAVPYPEGIIDPSSYFFFNREQIELIYFIGFQTQVEQHLRTWLEDKVAGKEVGLWPPKEKIV